VLLTSAAHAASVALEEAVAGMKSPVEELFLNKFPDIDAKA